MVRKSRSQFGDSNFWDAANRDEFMRGEDALLERKEFAPRPKR